MTLNRKVVDPMEIIRGMGAEKKLSPIELALFIGPQAREWDVEAAKKAAVLEAEGIDRGKIWQETGTFRGPDNTQRQELDDSRARFTGQSGTAATVFPQGGGLYSNYPRLMDTPINYQPRTSGTTRGSYGVGGEVNLTPKEGDDPVAILIHELQHAIQQREGLSSGQNSSRPGYWHNPGEAEARAAAARTHLTPAERQAKPPWESYDVPWGKLK